MGITRFGDCSVMLRIAAGMFARCQAQERREMLRCGKPAEIADFYQDGQSGMRSNPPKAAQLACLFLIALSHGEFLDPLVKALHLICQIAKSHQILLQSILEQRIGQAQCFQPVDVLLCPVAFSVKVIAMAGTQADDLLLRLFERSLCIIPHADIFFYDSNQKPVEDGAIEGPAVEAVAELAQVHLHIKMNFD